MTSPQFYATYAFFFVGMTMLNTVYMIASLRTNVAFLGIFVLLVPACEHPPEYGMIKTVTFQTDSMDK
jgi:hypothetical protein